MIICIALDLNWCSFCLPSRIRTKWNKIRLCYVSKEPAIGKHIGRGACSYPHFMCVCVCVNMSGIVRDMPLHLYFIIVTMKL